MYLYANEASFTFFFNEPTTTEFYTLSLHDALRSRIQPAEFYRFHDAEVNTFGYFCVMEAIKLDRKSGSAGMPRPISYAVFCLKKKNSILTLLPERSCV